MPDFSSSLSATVVWAGWACHSLREIIVIFLYLVQETVQAQSDLVLGTVHDKGNMEQVVLEIQKRFEAVSVDPSFFHQVCFWLCH